MNIQIFGTNKCFDTKKAQRWCKERGIAFQFVDLREKSMSKGELKSVMQAVGGMDKILNQNAKDGQTLTLLRYLSEADATEKLSEHPDLLLTPIVRSGRQATVGYHPEVWETWK